ncbi:hypothetical protein EDB85DRAFT_2277667 [Lactarius pseudohatsudake]|nr:hypothetical protein EDB85DRAFT_2277667 [Lactarius pseudohatsudake]
MSTGNTGATLQLRPLSFDSGQAFPSRLNTPSWAKSVPGPGAVTQSATTTSHGCQYQHFLYPSHGVIPYSYYPTRSVGYCPLSRFPVPRQGLPSLSPRWEDKPPIDGPQDRFPAPHLEKDAFLSASSFLAPGTGLFPVSGVPNALFIPDGRQTLVSPACDAPIAGIFPSSREELQLPEVWTRIHTPLSMAIQIDANRYPADNTGTGVGSCGFQDSGSQALDESRCAPPPEPERQLHFDRGQVTLASSLPPTVQLNGPLVASSIPTSVPQSQGRIADTTERCAKKTWCSLCKIGFSQSQVLSRHKKDKHELKESCSFCTSFKWSRGRPYLYKKHLRMRHFQNTPPNDRQKGSKAHKGNMKPQALAQNNSQANDVPPPAGDVDHQLTSEFQAHHVVKRCILYYLVDGYRDDGSTIQNLFTGTSSDWRIPYTQRDGRAMNKYIERLPAASHTLQWTGRTYSTQKNNSPWYGADDVSVIRTHAKRPGSLRKRSGITYS